jgi:hypothetical protein
MARSRAPRRSLWLIAKQENGRMGVLTLDTGSGSEALPIFSYEEEAEAVLQLGAPGADWRARKTTAGELIWLLYGPCAGVKKVALDPLPVVDCEMVLDLEGSGRQEFLRNFAGEPSTPQERPQAGVSISPELEKRAQERAIQTRETEEERTGDGTAWHELASIRDETPNVQTIPPLPSHNAGFRSFVGTMRDNPDDRHCVY